MKRLIPLLLCVFLLLSGCSDALPDAGALREMLEPEAIAPQVSRVSLTAENLAVFDLLGDNRRHDCFLADFTAPEGAQQVIVTQWIFQDGAWTAFERDALCLTAVKGRLGLTWDDLCNGANLILHTQEQTIAIAHENAADLSVSGLHAVTVFLSQGTATALHEEIPLLMRIVTDQVEVPVMPLACCTETWRFAGHKQAVMISLRFSDQPLENAEPPSP